MERPFKLTLPDRFVADAIMAHYFDDLPAALWRLGLGETPVLAIVGGAGRMTGDDYGRLKPLFVDVVAPLAQSLGATVIDGGTDAGVMKWMGQARAGIGGTFSLLGVAAVGTVNLPDRSNSFPNAASLASQHTHFIFVPGDRWGDESSWLARIASLLSEGFGSVTVVINGGETTWRDVYYSVQERRPTLVVAGSGRTADQLAGALNGEVTDARTGALVASGLVTAIGIGQDNAVIAGRLRNLLTKK